MYQSGDYVMYADSGLCLVEQVGVPSFSAEDKDSLYYFLRVADDGSRIYVPIDTSMPLRLPMTANEAETLLTEIGDIPVCVPERRDRKTLLSHYQTMLKPHTSQALAQIIKSIRWQHQQKPTRMSGAEEGMLKRAERQLCGELANALDITSDDARERLTEALCL